MADKKDNKATATYIPRPELGDTFADGVAGFVFDGQSRTLRLEFTARRYHAQEGTQEAAVTTTPVSRIVLSQDAIAALVNAVNATSESLVKAGVLQRRESASNAEGTSALN